MLNVLYLFGMLTCYCRTFSNSRLAVKPLAYGLCFSFVCFFCLASTLIFNIFTAVHLVVCQHIWNLDLHCFAVWVHTVLWAVFAEAQNVLSHSLKVAPCHISVHSHLAGLVLLNYLTGFNMLQLSRSLMEIVYNSFAQSFLLRGEHFVRPSHLAVRAEQNIFWRQVTVWVRLSTGAKTALFFCSVSRKLSLKQISS